MIFVLAGLVSVLVVAFTAYYYRRWGKDEFFGALLPGVVVTALGALLLMACYLWLFEQPASCDGRGDIACITNANQGLLTLLGLLIAVVAVWTGIATGAFSRKREKAGAETRTSTAVRDAIDELHHNLQHVAGAYDGNKLRLVPQITVDSTLRLLEPSNRLLLSSPTIASIEPLRRNAERLKELRAASKGPQATPPSKADPEPLGGFVRCSLEILVYLWRDHHAWACKSLKRPGLQDLPRFAGERVYLSFRSSKMHSRGPWLRTEEIPLVCWHNDQPIEGVKTYVVGQRFLDAKEAHGEH